MGLHGQDFERGYAMAALLVSLAVMSVLMSVALPVWRQQATREKEAELVFRGEQYARAIALYRTKFQGTLPTNLDVLVQQRFLRKKYKDPITGEDFVPIAGATTSQTPGPTPTQNRGPQTRRQTVGAGVVGGVVQPSQQPVGGGIVGVRSKSKDTSIRIYQGQTRYDMWSFTFNTVRRPGGREGVPGQGGPVPGGRGNRGIGPGGNSPGAPGGRGGRGRQSPGAPGTRIGGAGEMGPGFKPPPGV